ncbi:hypothetical protein DL770_010244 [Monosporascus sp. CRB-9-2]|nr:hypothetical protein DL770_010244 [Monosporascus sp. CRB-9-2]
MARMNLIRKLLAAISIYGGCVSTDATPRVIKRDVVIIGGGASGAHAALRLKDMGQSIMLVEKQAILGGAVDTYITPSAGTPVNYGVFSFIDYGGARAFLTRLNISTVSPPQFPSATRHVDFTTGEELTSYVSPEWTDVAAALEVCLEQCEKYEHMLVPGLWDFPEGADIPEDLLMNFGEFATKYGIEAALPTIFISTGLGVGKFADELTITVMQTFGGQMTRDFLGLQGSFVPASRRNQDVYDAIAALLGDDVLYSTTAMSAGRNEDGVMVTVRNRENGSLATIHAARLLIAIPPLVDLLEPFDLDAHEEAVFSQWEYTREYAVLSRSPFLTALNESVANLPLAAQPSSYLRTPDLSFVDQFRLLGGPDELALSRIVGDEALDGYGARLLLRTQFDALVAGSDAASPAGTEEELEVVAFADHGPMHLRVSAENHRRGFYRDLYALQGYRSTWYTGSAFASNFQTVLWEYNEILLPQMLGS